MSRKLLVSLGVCGWLLGATAHLGAAGELEGVKMPDTKIVAGKNLVLNGMGMREATMFKVDVYVAGLYLESPSQDASAILNSPGVKHVDLHFVREVEAKDIREAWSKSIRENCGRDC